MIVITVDEDGNKFHVHRHVDGVVTDITADYELRYFPLEDERGPIHGFHVGRRPKGRVGQALVMPSLCVVPQSIDVFDDGRGDGKEL